MKIMNKSHTVNSPKTIVLTEITVLRYTDDVAKRRVSIALKGPENTVVPFLIEDVTDQETPANNKTDYTDLCASWKTDGDLEEFIRMKIGAIAA